MTNRRQKELSNLVETNLMEIVENQEIRLVEVKFCRIDCILDLSFV